MVVQTSPSPPATPDPDVEAGVIEDARKRQRRHRRIAGLLIAAAIAAAVLVAGFGGGGGGPGAQGRANGDPSGSGPGAGARSSRVDQQLKSILAVLRRPQTAYDRKVLRQSRLLNGPVFGGGIDPASARVVTITPWGTRVLLVLTRGEASGPSRDRRVAGRRVMSIRQAGLILEEGHGEGCCSTAANVETGVGGASDGWGRSFAGGSTGFRFYQVIPDGVSKVTFVIPRDSSPGQYGAPVYRRALYVTVPVRGNSAALEEAHRELSGASMAEVWYAADGRVIKRIGNFAAVNRVKAAPKPGPQTAQSLAAERDPSTPNPVWVSPAVGRPHTKLTIHFHVLLNGADYQYRFTGTQCRRYTFTGGTGKPNALRGSLWSDGVNAIQGQALCPGTYRVAVSVFDLGRAGYVHRPVKPFGSAAFTVR